MKGSGDFGIGSAVWPGLGKVLEEMGEVAQMASKLISTDGEDRYWDGTDLRAELVGEIGDLQAALDFLIFVNCLDTLSMAERKRRKFDLFIKWHNAVPETADKGGSNQ